MAGDGRSSVIRLLRALWRKLDAQPVSYCRCYDYDGGPYGYDAHECAHGCPEHGPCWCRGRRRS
jgi:hypothetical protein